MRTIIFILACTVLAAPVFANDGDAKTCVTNTKNCNLCIEVSSAAADQCFDCKAGYVLATGFTTTTGTCQRCTAGQGVAQGSAANSDAGSTRSSKQGGACAACHSTCAQCFGITATDCTRCAVGKYSSTAFMAGTGATCGNSCPAGKTRDVATSDLSGAAETEAAVCVNCHASCALCLGTAATGCTKCAVGFYGTAYSGTSQTATCAACDAGTTRNLASGNLSGDETKGTTCVNCGTGCATCYGTGNDKCTKCKADTYATAPTAAAAPAPAMATCTACDVGTFRTAPTDNVPAAAEAKTVCNVGCDATCAACKGAPKSCTKCAVGHYLSAKAADADDFGTCVPCTGGKGKNADADAFATTTKAATNDAACTATCTPASNCGSCSAVTADAGKCLTCPTDYKLDTTANTCTKAEAPKTASASLLQALCGASVAAYALF